MGKQNFLFDYGVAFFVGFIGDAVRDDGEVNFGVDGSFVAFAVDYGHYFGPFKAVGEDFESDFEAGGAGFSEIWYGEAIGQGAWADAGDEGWGDAVVRAAYV